MYWQELQPNTDPWSTLGIIPTFLDDADPLTAREQIHRAYQGGWSPFVGFKLLAGDRLAYPGDPPMAPLWRAMLRNEEIVVYDSGWVLVRQADQTWEVARLD